MTGIGRVQRIIVTQQIIVFGRAELKCIELFSVPYPFERCKCILTDGLPFLSPRAIISVLYTELP